MRTHGHRCKTLGFPICPDEHEYFCASYGSQHAFSESLQSPASWYPYCSKDHAPAGSSTSIRFGSSNQLPHLAMLSNPDGADRFATEAGIQDTK